MFVCDAQATFTVFSLAIDSASKRSRTSFKQCCATHKSYTCKTVEWTFTRSHCDSTVMYCGINHNTRPHKSPYCCSQDTVSHARRVVNCVTVRLLLSLCTTYTVEGIGGCFNHLIPTVAILGTAIKHPVADRVKQSFVIFTRATLCYRGLQRSQRVCLSVCLSVTRRYCVKTKKASVMISSPSRSPKTLVYV